MENGYLVYPGERPQHAPGSVLLGWSRLSSGRIGQSLTPLAPNIQPRNQMYRPRAFLTRP